MLRKASVNCGSASSVSMNTSMACTDSSRVELVVDVLGRFGEARLRVRDGGHSRTQRQGQAGLVARRSSRGA
jgi:hypothetical protein